LFSTGPVSDTHRKRQAPNIAINAINKEERPSKPDGNTIENHDAVGQKQTADQFSPSDCKRRQEKTCVAAAAPIDRKDLYRLIRHHLCAPGCPRKPFPTSSNNERDKQRS
jgi:hypothetical protein